MPRQLAAIAALMLAACSAAAPTPPSASTDAAPTAQPVARFIKIEAMPSVFVQPRNVTIWLPPGYDPAGPAYPVIYAHDGQNMFHPGYSGDGGKEWQVDETAARLVSERVIRAPIIVGIWNTDKRWEEYAPQRVVERIDPLDVAPDGDMPALLADAYLRFIVEELKPKIDADYNTAPGKADTTIMGSSMGGLISLYAAAEYPDVFGRAACVSIHWPLGNPDGPIADAAAPAMVAYLSEDAKLDPAAQTLWFDNGTGTLDAYYPPYAAHMEAFFRQRGWTPDQARFTTYGGTDHSETSWAARVDDILVFLLGPPA